MGDMSASGYLPQMSRARTSQYIDDYEVQEPYNRNDKEGSSSPLQAGREQRSRGKYAPVSPGWTEGSQKTSAKKDDGVCRKLRFADTETRQGFGTREEGSEQGDVMNEFKKDRRGKENNVDTDTGSKMGGNEEWESENKRKRNKGRDEHETSTRKTKSEGAGGSVTEGKRKASGRRSSGGAGTRREGPDQHSKELDTEPNYSENIERHPKKRSKRNRGEATNKNKRQRKEERSNAPDYSPKIGGKTDKFQKKKPIGKRRGSKVSERGEDRSKFSEYPSETSFEEDASPKKRPKPKEKASHSKKQRVSESIHSDADMPIEAPLSDPADKNGRKCGLTRREGDNDNDIPSENTSSNKIKLREQTTTSTSDLPSLTNPSDDSSVSLKKTPSNSPIERSSKCDSFGNTWIAADKSRASEQPSEEAGASQ